MKNNNKDTAPKRPGRPKKKAIGGEKVLKEYRSKRRKLARMRRTKEPSALLPSIPTVISSRSIHELDKSIDTLAKRTKYKIQREKLLDIGTKIDVRHIPDTPNHITWASVNKLTKMVNKYQSRLNNKRRYEEIREKIKELPWHVRLPHIPDVITERSVERLEKIYEKYKDKAPQYRDKVTVTPEDVERAEVEERLEKWEALEVEDYYPEDKEPQWQPGGKEPPQPGQPQTLEEEVLDAYRDFVSRALDYYESYTVWERINGWPLEEDYWSNRVYQHGMNCLAMITDLESESYIVKRKAIKNLIIKAGDIYRDTEYYLFLYTSYDTIDDGASLLEDIESALREAVGEELSYDSWKEWSEIQGRYGVMIDV